MEVFRREGEKKEEEEEGEEGEGGRMSMGDWVCGDMNMNGEG